MNHLNLFYQTSFDCSRLITQRYSTSFSMGIRVFEARFQNPIYGIYGFVRFADEIVDTLYDFPQQMLFQRFREDTFSAIHERISLNPVLHAFQSVVHQYGIEHSLIEAFLKSMEMDLDMKSYDNQGYENYIYGSAEVVGLMCLRVFTENNDQKYQNLKSCAQKLGAAFQKINFLRDIKSDYVERGRCYFPNVDFECFSAEDKKNIERDIQKDFDEALLGIRKLPKGVRFGVYLAYKYYVQLFKKIKNSTSSRITQERFRVSDKRKVYLLLSSAIRNTIGAI